MLTFQSRTNVMKNFNFFVSNGFSVNFGLTKATENQIESYFNRTTYYNIGLNKHFICILKL